MKPWIVFVEKALELLGDTVIELTQSHPSFPRNTHGWCFILGLCIF